MGVGMTVVVAPEDKDTALAILKENGVDAYELGKIKNTKEKVTIC